MTNVVHFPENGVSLKAAVSQLRFLGSIEATVRLALLAAHECNRADISPATMRAVSQDLALALESLSRVIEALSARPTTR